MFKITADYQEWRDRFQSLEDVLTELRRVPQYTLLNTVVKSDEGIEYTVVNVGWFTYGEVGQQQQSFKEWKKDNKELSLNLQPHELRIKYCESQVEYFLGEFYLINRDFFLTNSDSL